MAGKKKVTQKTEMKKILAGCIGFGQTTGIDTPTAIQRFISARKGEVSQEKEKIRKAKLKIKKIEVIRILAEKVLTNFWIKETNKRKIK